jgi:phosphotransferase system enzyme I (PtsP)
MRADGDLELFATEGLNREAVHLTTMQAGEGLVGLIARTAEPLALSDAQTHPAFSYRPETGEEIYHAFLGVPLLRAGNTLGVLVVQNRTYRVYAEEELEALQTTSMVLAEMLASGELQALAPGGATVLRRPLHPRGVSLVGRRRPRLRGAARAPGGREEPHRRNTEGEIKRLEQAIGEVRVSIDELIERGDVAHHGEHREVLEPSACSPTTKVGSGACARRCRPA